jgi:N-acetylglucosamine repressor
MSAERISSHESMKLNNQLVVLNRIRTDGPISRVTLRERTRPSWGTITSTIKDLLWKGIIQETGTVTTEVGRRPIELDLNIERNFVLGLHLGTTMVRSSLVDIKGKVVGELDTSVNPDGSLREILGHLKGTAHRLLQAHALTTRRLAGIGVAAPGAVDFGTGVCLYAPHHPHWKNVPLRALMEKEFGVPCFVDHAYNCSTLSEKLFGFGRDVDSFVCVLLGTGVSAGIVIKGELYRGADYLSGEFGHTCIDLNGPACVCGNSGCLETYVSGYALARLASEEIRRAPGSRLAATCGGNGGEVSGETLCIAAQKGDPRARKIFARMGTYLGVGVANLISLLNPSRIIIGGGLSRAKEFFLPTFQDVVERRAWYASGRDIRISAIQRATVLGAAALVLQELFASGRILKRRS